MANRLNRTNIELACSKSKETSDLPNICNSSPINETKGYANRVRIWQVSGEDWAVFGLYFGAMLAIGLLSAFRNRGSLSGFFLTARSANWLLIGMSILASNIGSSHFIGVAGTAADYGISISVYEFSGAFFLPLLGWVFAPVYMASNAATMPEYLRARFGGRRIQIYIACVALILYIFTKISSDLYAGTLYLNQTLGFERYIAVILLLVVSAFFTILGGMTAVLWTNAFQLLVILMGSLYMLARVLSETGGMNELFLKYVESKPNLSLSDHTGHSPQSIETIEACSHTHTPEYAFHLYQPIDDDNVPWPGAIFGLSISSLWYWCSDQVITQHVLASKNLSHAKFGSLLAAVMKLLTPFVFVLPGMAARVLYPDFIGCADPVLCCCYCKSKTGCVNYAYTLLIAADNGPNNKENRLLPHGARGLMAITVVSALISSFTATFNACSAIFTMDIWRLVRRQATSKELQIVGRVFIVIVCTISMLWMVIVSNESYLFSYIQSITAYFSPPLASIFLLAVFWKRCNEQGAFYGLIVGLLIGIIRIGLEFNYEKLSCAELYLQTRDLTPPALRNVHYLHFAIILFVITTLVTVCLSLVSKPPDPSRISALTYWTRYEQRMTRRPKDKRRSTNCSSQKDDENRFTTPGEKTDDDNVNEATNNKNDLAVSNLFREQEQRQKDESRLYFNNNQRKIAKWRHLINWLCGIESFNDMDMLRRSTAASWFMAPSMPQRFSTTSQQQQQQPQQRLTQISVAPPSLVPISSALYEETWLRILSSIALVAVLTAALFVLILLW